MKNRVSGVIFAQYFRAVTENVV